MQAFEYIEIVFSTLKEAPLWVFLSIATAIYLYSPARKTKHYFKIKSSKRYLNTLSNISVPARQYSYLRKIDPFVFEEMILSSFERLGYRIERNMKYTGDGGIDGKVEINGQLTLIQAKRYKSHINAAHVIEFSKSCNQQRRKGLFVHTGRTGKLSRDQAATGEIHIISGSKLLDLLAHGKFVPPW